MPRTVLPSPTNGPSPHGSTKRIKSRVNKHDANSLPCRARFTLSESKHSGERPRYEGQLSDDLEEGFDSDFLDFDFESELFSDPLDLASLAAFSPFL